MIRSSLISLLAAALLSACGGTGTLYVVARFSSDGSTASSRARVVVREAASTGSIVEDAQVFINGAKLPKTGLPFAMNSNDYRADGFGWDDNLRVEVTLSMAEVATGAKRSLKLRTQATCETCAGTGAKPENVAAFWEFCTKGGRCCNLNSSPAQFSTDC